MAHFGEDELGADPFERLRGDTQYYWEFTWDPLEVETSLTKYITTLLPQELAAAQEIGDRLPTQKCRTLVLLVGFSLEPLLQAVCAYAPEEVLLILNESYGREKNGPLTGHMVGERLETLINKLPGAVGGFLQRAPAVAQRDEQQEFFETCADRPDEIFRFLLRHLQPAAGDDEPQDGRLPVVIDITGAKKSMIAGAYLYGALTRQTLSYVDFAEYDQKSHRPYGYSCLIGPIDNPYQTFQLANWNRVRQYYDRYALQSAEESLQEMLQAIPADLFPDEQRQRLGRLQRFLTFYRCWEANDVVAAYRAWPALQAQNVPPPLVVQEVGPAWDQLAAPPADEVAEPLKLAKEELGRWATLLGEQRWPLMLAYARDELAKIQRLAAIRRDWRSAAVRGVSLLEYLFKFRLLILTSRTEWLQIRPDFNIFLRLQLNDIVSAIHFVRNPEMTAWPSEQSAKLTKGQQLPSDLTMPSDWETTIDDIRELRNRTLHNQAVIPEAAAQQLVTILEDNWDNLRQSWLPLIGVASASVPPAADGLNSAYTLPAWPALLRECKIDFLPVAGVSGGAT